MNKVVILGRLTMQGLISGDSIDAEGIKQTLIDEGVACIKDTDL